MTAKIGSLKAFRRYETILLDKAVSPQCGPETPASDSHLLWMCQHSIERIEADDETFPVDKYSRWLGFVQGVMSMLDYVSVQEERNITRPWFTGEEYE